MNDTDRIYAIFKRNFDKYNGTLGVPLDKSDKLCDIIGWELCGEFVNEMYQRWINEGNIDK